MELVKYINDSFWSSSGYMVLYVISLIWLLMLKKEEKRAKWMAFYSALCWILIVYNPILAEIAVAKFMEDGQAYLRICYLMPVMTIIAYAATSFFVENVKKEDSRKKHVIWISAICGAVVLSGEFFSSDMFLKAENVYKIDNEALKIADIILEEYEDEQIRVLLPEDENLTYGIRQYTNGIVFAGFLEEMENYTTLKKHEMEKEYSYLVIGREQPTVNIIEKKAYQRVGATENYYVYRVLEE